MPLVLSCFLQPHSAAAQAVLEEFAGGFIRPVAVTHAGDSRLFVAEQAGRIRVVDTGGVVREEPFLDISSRVLSTGNEQGLLGLAFHPDYGVNGYFFVNYTDAGGHTVIARFSAATGNPDQADTGNMVTVLTLEQPYSNHNGGDIKFGPDGYLYIGLGDGGSAGDPQDRAQDPGQLLGKMLRIDVDGGEPYTIPVDNPFM
ncbi:MAG: cadherin, partial [Bacteroidetes bacterium]